MKRKGFDKVDVPMAAHLFSTDSFWQLNKALVYKYGFEVAGFLSVLIDRFKYLAQKGLIQDEGWFFCKHDHFMAMTNMGIWKIREAKKQLKDDKILHSKLKGSPPVELFFIDFEKLVKTVYPTGLKGVSPNIRKPNALNVRNPNDYRHPDLIGLAAESGCENPSIEAPSVKVRNPNVSLLYNNNINKNKKINKKSLDFVPIDERDYFDTILHNLWLPYKDEQGKGYKSQQSYDILKKHLLEYSGGDKKKAKKVLERSMGNNWAGIFPYQEEGSQGKQSYKKPQGQVLTKPISEMTEEEIEEYNSRGHLFLNHDQKNNSYLDREPDFIV